ncbi:hypothetical protein MUY14_33780 [Amycolatopsis sp. FBCC-B4732]|nr:hypothetical protein [Amycolatopsis sp. FBCC-B4732]UOX86683.1 hypothetical protein MUY14_33780 [Amycolatopsis sp. FBCC-B4732]
MPKRNAWKPASRAAVTFSSRSSMSSTLSGTTSSRRHSVANASGVGLAHTDVPADEPIGDVLAQSEPLAQQFRPLAHVVAQARQPHAGGLELGEQGDRALGEAVVQAVLLVRRPGRTGCRPEVRGGHLAEAAFPVQLGDPGPVQHAAVAAEVRHEQLRDVVGARVEHTHGVERDDVDRVAIAGCEGGGRGGHVFDGTEHTCDRHRWKG